MSISGTSLEFRFVVSRGKVFFAAFVSENGSTPSHESRIPVNSRNMGHTENRNSGVRVHLVALKSGKNGTISLPLKL